MKQILAIEQTASLPAGTVHLRYRLLAETKHAGEAHYSAAAEITETGEWSAVLDLTTNRTLALEFLRRISQGAVTPVTLVEVAEDFVAEI